jgi:TP901 family phage tail tape measure protein
MSSSVAFAFILGAALNKEHSRTVSKVQADFNGLGKTVKELSSTRKTLERFGKSQDSFMKAAQGAREATTRFKLLKTEFSKAPSDALKRQMDKASEAMEKTRAKAFEQRAALNKLRDELKRAGVNTNQLAKEQIRLGKAFEETKKRQNALGSVKAARAELGTAFSAAQGRFAIGAAALYGTGRSISRPVMAAANFEDQIRQIAITGEFAGTGQEVSLGKAVQQASIKYHQNTAAINEGLQTLVAEGVDPKKAEIMAGNLSEFATATRATFADAAKMTANFSKVLGISDENMKIAYSQAAKAGKLGSFEISDMAKWFPVLGGTMKAIGVVGNEAVVSMSSRLQIAKYTAGSSDEAANNFKNFLNKLTSQDTKKAFAKLGIDLHGSMMKAAAKGLDPIETGVNMVMGQMAKKSPESVKALKSLSKEVMAIKDPAERAAELERRAGMIQAIGERAGLGTMFRDAQAVAYLIAEVQNREKLKEMQAEVRSGKTATGEDVIEADFKSQTELTTTKVGDVGRAWERVSQVLGKSVKPVTDYVLEKTAWIGNFVADIAESSPKASLGIASVLGAAVVGKAGFGLFHIYRATTGLLGALTNLGKAEAAAGVGVVGKFAGVMDKLKTAAPSVSRIGGFLGKSGKFLGLFGTLFTAGIGIASAADETQTAETRARGGAGAAGAIAGGLAGAKLGAAVGTAIAPGIGTAVGGLVGGIIGSIAGEKALGEIGAAIARWWPKITAKFDEIGPYFANMFNRIVSDAVAAWEEISTKVSTAWGQLKEWAAATFSGVLMEINIGFNGAMDYLGKLPGKFFDYGKNILGGLTDGIKSRIGSAVSAIGDTAKGITDWFSDKLKIESPSRVFFGFGENIGQGAALGISSMGRTVARASGALGVAASLAFQPALAAPAPVVAPAPVSAGRAPAAAPALAAPAPVVNQRFEFHIVQQPGEDGEALARRVAEMVRREGQIQRRGALGDWA